MEFVQNFTPPDFQTKNFTPSISPNFNSFSLKKHKKLVKMEKFTPLAKILRCRRHWRHGQIPPLNRLQAMLANLMTLNLAKDCFCKMATKAPLELLVTKHWEVDERIQLKKWMKSCNFNGNIKIVEKDSRVKTCLVHSKEGLWNGSIQISSCSFLWLFRSFQDYFPSPD